MRKYLAKLGPFWLVMGLVGCHHEAPRADCAAAMSRENSLGCLPAPVGRWVTDCEQGRAKADRCLPQYDVWVRCLQTESHCGDCDGLHADLTTCSQP